MKYFKLPDLGEGLQEAEIVRWHVNGRRYRQGRSTAGVGRNRQGAGGYPCTL